ncbi:choline transport ATP-binding protein OpuBA [Andreesenia angusta]|uniref:Quaternary amine transport ATP-binding protein n=1 Tax=Andreesenia angusta TaxID=39480 RepID=A0A1S1V9S0_9FIRM|nr:ABC transporter ATP-binding protein [Andreesenia angusta]OHW62877.1 choline transport ATP-binding protein OpuBA [Andreesenia angusta]
MIKLENICKRYDENGDYVIKDLNLSIEKGEICIFIGPSGCGKSTTLKMINRMVESTSGEIYIDGENIKDKDEDKLRMKIGYVIQQVGLLPHKTVAENIAIVPKLFGWDKAKIASRVEELLEMVGLDPREYRDKYPKHLSGGQMQRVGVARALAADPPIMLMDEPFGAVDPIVRKSIQDEFLKIQKKIKKTVCFVTHDINEAIKMGDRIAVFNDKNIVQIDKPRNIILNPADDFVREFIGIDGATKSYSFIKVREVVEYLSSKNKIRKEKLDYSVSCYAKASEVIDKMISNNVYDINVKDENEIIGNISFEDLNRYLEESRG